MKPLFPSPFHPDDLADSEALPDGDPPPVELVNPQATRPLLIVCDHAANRIPARLAGLGLPPDALLRHIAWDIGAAAVSRGLAARLAATAVLSTVSRLVIDCNRRPDHATAICGDSDGTVIPGNQGLSAAERSWRQETVFTPYHRAIASQAARLERDGRVTAVVAIHSFTPVMGGAVRPWQIGILWNRDPRLARPLLAALEAGGLRVGDNQPYSGRSAMNHTTDIHGQAEGRPHLSIEIRQDLLVDPAAAEDWAALLAETLAPLLDRPENRCRRRF